MAKRINTKLQTYVDKKNQKLINVGPLIRPQKRKNPKLINVGPMGHIFCTEIKILNSESHDLGLLSLYTF